MAPLAAPDRLAPAVGAVAVAAAVGGLSAASRPEFGGALTFLVGLAVAVIAGGVVLRAFPAVAAGVAMVGGTFVVVRIGRPLDLVASTAVAAALFLVLELCDWSISSAHAVAWEPAVARRRRRDVAVAVAATGAGGLLVALSGLAGRGAGIALVAVGGVAAVGLLGWSLRLARIAVRR